MSALTLEEKLSVLPSTNIIPFNHAIKTLVAVPFASSDRLKHTYVVLSLIRLEKCECASRVEAAGVIDRWTAVRDLFAGLVV